MQSRYYNPELGRFINGDDRVSSVGGSLLGYNPFAYCFNNPNNLSDDNGYWPKWIKNTIKKVVQKINPIVKKIQKKTADKKLTASIGQTFSANLGMLVGSATPSVAIDAKGNLDIQFSWSIGLTTSQSFSTSSGTALAVTGAPTVSDLTKLDTVTIGGSSFYQIPNGPAVGGGLDANFMTDPQTNKTYFGLSTFTGVAPVGGSEGHLAFGYTYSLYSINLYECYDNLYEQIMGW